MFVSSLEHKSLAVEEVCSHQQLQRNLRSDGELRDFSGAVCVADLVGEIDAHSLQHMRPAQKHNYVKKHHPVATICYPEYINFPSRLIRYFC